MLLDEHGTRLCDLKAPNLIQAAASDLKRKQRKAEGAERRAEPYAFHRLHVRKAKEPRELIALAAAEPERGQASGKRNTRLIYAARELLARALDLLGGGVEQLSLR
jgi:hypothetical protein